MSSCTTVNNFTFETLDSSIGFCAIIKISLEGFNLTAENVPESLNFCKLFLNTYKRRITNK
jgi:hypothetical protein